MDFSAHADQLVWTLIYAFLGVLMLGTAFLAIVRATPFSVRHEIEEDHNTALAVVIAAFILGLSIIIAAAIAG